MLRRRREDLRCLPRYNFYEGILLQLHARETRFLTRNWRVCSCTDPRQLSKFKARALQSWGGVLEVTNHGHLWDRLKLPCGPHRVEIRLGLGRGSHVVEHVAGKLT